MRSTVLRTAGALLGASFGIVALAAPAEAANATVLYRSTSDVRITPTSRTCKSFFANTPLSVKMTRSLRVGTSAFANTRTISCTGGGTNKSLYITMGEDVSWNSSRVATAQHRLVVNEWDFISGLPPRVCVPTTPDAQNNIRITSGQQGTVTAEFNEVERAVSAIRTVTCPTLGRLSVTIALTEGWSAVS